MYFDVAMVEIGLPVLRCLKDDGSGNWTRVDRKGKWNELEVPAENCFMDKKGDVE